MRPSRLRFTVRRMMILVAVAGAVLAAWGVLERRRSRFERLFGHHMGLTGPMTIRTFAPDRPIFETAKGRWHYDLAMKYGRAVRHPWLPVEPDPPEPQ